MSASDASTLPTDESMLKHLSSLESKLLPYLDAANPTSLALTHLLYTYVRRGTCVCCNKVAGLHHAVRPSVPSIHAFANLSIRQLAVMSRRKLLSLLCSIARDWMCRKCLRSKSMPIEQKSIALGWVKETRRVIAMLERRECLKQGKPCVRHPIVDLTNTPQPRPEAGPCMICMDPLDGHRSEKACFQCGMAIHEECFRQHREFEDLNQLNAPTTERETLHLPCIFCRCIVASVPRSEAGKTWWDRRVRASEAADREFARTQQEMLETDEGLWGTQHSINEVFEDE
ncbi:unnamed protein product [Zymoseptoria tritici ST99CH_1E4]|uniref:RING-type domain-containing protein n=1 Tax=Zymoseptoria tritici ST99CH_1E4 TaxID=1276532 RepID=A0A2H1HA01_ZYMTR|nr:unnamed protein product [Zymoseptoria tritici ST99CH_1E4]